MIIDEIVQKYFYLVIRNEKNWLSDSLRKTSKYAFIACFEYYNIIMQLNNQYIGIASENIFINKIINITVTFIELHYTRNTTVYMEQ